VVDEAVWQRQEEKAQSKSPGFIEILNEQEVSVYFKFLSIPYKLTLQSS